MNFWLDLITVAILVLFAYIGFKRGAARSLANLCGTLVASVGSVFIGTMISKSIYTLFVKNSVINKITAVILEKGSGTAEVTLNKIFDTLPQYVRGAIESFGFSVDDFMKALNLENTQKIAEQIETMIAPIITTFISVITITVIFIAIRIVLRFVVKMLENLMKIFMVSFVNSLAGGIIGLAEGLVLIIVLAVILRIATPLVAEMPALLSPDTVQQTSLFKYLYNFDFFYDIQRYISK